MGREIIVKIVVFVKRKKRYDEFVTINILKNNRNILEPIEMEITNSISLQSMLLYKL